MAAKLPSKKTLKLKADKLWSWAVKDDWAWRCAVCRCVNDLQSHHLITKGSCNAHRYTLANGICLCVSHHMFDSHCSAHEATIGFNDFLSREHPHLIKWVLDRQHDRLEGSSVSQGWYVDQIVRLRELVDDTAAMEILGPRLYDRIEAERTT